MLNVTHFPFSQESCLLSLECFFFLPVFIPCDHNPLLHCFCFSFIDPSGLEDKSI